MEEPQVPGQERDPAVLSVGLLGGFAVLGFVGTLISLVIGAWGHAAAFACMGIVGGVVAWWVRRPVS